MRRVSLSRRHEAPREAAESERRCLVTRESGPRGGLVRFAVGPDGAVVPDVDERLPGRGLWVGAGTHVARYAPNQLLASGAPEPDSGTS